MSQYPRYLKKGYIKVDNVFQTVQEKQQKPKPPSGWIVVGKVSTVLAVLGLLVLFVGSQLKPVKSIAKPKQSEAIMLLAK
jgi:hypothetical protein